MSAALFIVLDDENPGFSTFVNGKAIAREVEGLNEVAVFLGLPQLWHFFSYEPEEALAVMEMCDADPAEVGELPPAEWFRPEEGLYWVEAMRQHLTANESVVRDPRSVLDELDEYEAVLRKAKNIGAKWRLLVDF
jgi:hypothetical protein